MKLLDRYKRLSIWNKIGLIGAIASIIALLFPFIIFIYDILFPKNVWNQESILQLGNQCVWYNNDVGGNRNSFSTLQKIKNNKRNRNEIVEAASTQIDRLKDLYRTERRKRASKEDLFICIPNTECVKKEDPDNPTPKNTIHHLLHASEWTARAHAAFILRNVKPERLKEDGKEWRDVFTALINRMHEKNEYSLLVSVNALETYSNICPTYKPSDTSDILDFKGAITHWEQNGGVCLK
jgi:hypothetical protein